ncbi:MAG: methyltransferase family protein [Anaerotardibacter sp.]
MVLAISITLAVIAYILFFAYDWISVRKPQVAYTSFLFGVGVILVIVSTLVLLLNSFELVSVSLPFIAGIVIVVISLGATIWSLVFSLPKGTYSNPGEPRKVYEGGAYALCRHPGVFFYCCLYIGLLIALPSFVNFAGFFILCSGNVAYMLFQDKWTFPLLLEGYEEYKKRSNLFIPRISARVRA